MIPCPACQASGWLRYTLRPKTTPCLDFECIEGNGMVPEEYTPTYSPFRPRRSDEPARQGP